MTDVILRISGMDCGACVVRIVRALQGLPGVHAVSVSDTAGCARLTYDEAAVGLGEIARCVQRAGFDVPVETAELRCPGRPRVSPRRQRSAERPSGASCSRAARRRRPRGRRAPCAGASGCCWRIMPCVCRWLRAG